MLDTSKPDKKIGADYKKQIDEVYRKLEIKQPPESVQQNSSNKSESPFSSNSYYLFK